MKIAQLSSGAQNLGPVTGRPSAPAPSHYPRQKLGFLHALCTASGGWLISLPLAEHAVGEVGRKTSVCSNGLALGALDVQSLGQVRGSFTFHAPDER